LLILVKPFGRCSFVTSDFPSENPRIQNRNVPYTNTLATSREMNIKSTLIIILTICFIQISFGQNELKIKKSKNYRLIKVLNNSELIGENRENYLSVKIYSIDNGTGSAGFESSEVSHNLLIAVSEFDEEPNQNLFEIGSFYNPKFIKWTDKEKFEKEFEIEYGIHNNRKTIKLKININELKMEK